MALDTYKKKRHFNATPEPPPRVESSPAGPLFVVQEHHATRLHYDFRLEAGGVLKSWAVTKEPTLDPKVRRLAVQVEDHPVAYAGFHGDIPRGHYGAGHVEIWDSGRYEPLGRRGAEPPDVAEALEQGHLEFRLHGDKLRGRFALIRMKSGGGKNWVLLKLNDEAARPSAAPPAARAAAPKAARSSPPPARLRARPPAAVELTHGDKLLFPEAGLTKGDLFRHYERVADRLLPHLAQRPMTLERLPEGLGGPHFWQKDTPAHYPAWIPRIELQSERGEPVRYALVNDQPTLLYLVNQGTVTFHPWLSRVEQLDRPDFVLFDLDPGERPFADVIEAARAVHDALRAEGAEAFVKTSGKSGLHVLSPWTRRGGYDEARAWATEIAGRVVEARPRLATLERSKAKRRGKLYLDVMQNARGHHVVPPYVVRAVPSATVSTPLRWKELTAGLAPSRFDITSLGRRLARMSDDPIEPLLAPAASGRRARAAG